MLRFLPFAFALAVSLTADSTAALAQKKADSKSLLKTKVTIKLANARTTDLFAEIEKKTKIKFMVDTKALEQAGVMDFDKLKIEAVDVKDESLENVLKAALKNGKVTFKVEKGYILVVPDNK